MRSGETCWQGKEMVKDVRDKEKSHEMNDELRYALIISLGLPCIFDRVDIPTRQGDTT